MRLPGLLLAFALLALPSASAATLHAAFGADGAGVLAFAPPAAPSAAAGGCALDTARWRLEYGVLGVGPSLVQSELRISGGQVAWVLRSAAPADLRVQASVRLHVPHEMERTLAEGRQAVVLPPGATTVYLPLAFNGTRPVQEGETLRLDLVLQGVPCGTVQVETVGGPGGTRLDLDARDEFLVRYVVPTFQGDVLDVEVGLVSPWGLQAFGPEATTLRSDLPVLGREPDVPRGFPGWRELYGERWRLDARGLSEGTHPLEVHATDLLGHKASATVYAHVEDGRRYTVDSDGRQHVADAAAAPLPLALVAVGLAGAAASAGRRR